MKDPMAEICKHLPDALRNAWICNPKMVEVITDLHNRNRAIINDGIFVEEFSFREIRIIHDKIMYRIAFSEDYQIREWQILFSREKSWLCKDYKVNKNSVIIDQTETEFTYKVVGIDKNNNPFMCFRKENKYHVAHILKDGLYISKVDITSCSVIARLFNSEATPEKEQNVKKYLKDKTLYNFKIPGSTEVEVTKKDGKFYILSDELKEDNRPEAEVMREKVIAELKANLPPDTPEWEKQLLAIFEAYQTK